MDTSPSSSSSLAELTAHLDTIQSDISALEEERRELQRQLSAHRDDTVAELYCPLTGQRVLLTRGEWGSAMAALDALHRLEGAGPSNDLLPWTVGIGGAKRFARRVTRAAVDWLIPQRTAVACGGVRSASSPAGTAEGGGGADKPSGVPHHIVSGYNGWSIRSRRVSSRRGRGMAMLREGEGADTNDDAASDETYEWLEEVRQRKEKRRDSAAADATVGGDAVPSDDVSAAADAQLLCIGHPSSDGVWSRQCVSHNEAAVLYLQALDEAPRVAAMCLAQGIMTALTFVFLWRTFLKAMRSVGLNQRRKRVMGRALGAEVDELYAKNTNSAAAAARGGGTSGGAKGRSPSPSPASASAPSAVVMSRAQRHELRRDRDTLQSRRWWANVKTLLAGALLVAVPIASSLLSWLVEGGGAEAASEMGGIGGAGFSILRGTSWVVNYMIGGDLGGGGGGGLTTATYIAITLICMYYVGVLVASAAVALMMSAAAELNSDSYKGLSQRMRRRAVDVVVAKRTTSPSSPPQRQL